MSVGVRAEPKFLRDSTSLEYISSGLSWVSLYLASNIQRRRSNGSFSLTQQQQHDPHLQKLIDQHQQHNGGDKKNNESSSCSNVETSQSHSDDSELVTFATFQIQDFLSSSSSLLLLLGYKNGFQIWDVTSPENVHETCSIRDTTASVVQYMHILAEPELRPGCVDPYAEFRPLLAIISANNDDHIRQSPNGNQNDDGSSPSPPSIAQANIPTRLRIFSLRTQEVVKEFTDLADQGIKVVNLQSSSRSIALGCIRTEDQAASLNILSALDLEQQGNPLTDVYYHHHPSSTSPVFALGSRYIAYATTATSSDRSTNMGFLSHVVNDKDVKGAVKDIAKEVVHGVRSLSVYSYDSISNYFASTDSPTSPASANGVYSSNNEITGAINGSNNIGAEAGRRQRRPSSSISGSNGGILSDCSSASSSQQGAGWIMIRDLQKIQSVCTHFQAHTKHAITSLTFNPSGTLLLSASNQGHKFHVFSLASSSSWSPPASSSWAPTTGELSVTHLYSLSRGITDAQVDDVQFSTDSLWCAVSTARGTTHVYPINPYGGPTEIPGHVQGKVVNSKHHLYPTAAADYNHNHRRTTSNSFTILNSVARIKQRRSMQADIQDFHNSTAFSTSQSCTPSKASLEAENQHHRPDQPSAMIANAGILAAKQRYRAKLATQFLPVSKTPYLLSGSSIPDAARRAWASSWKTQVSSLINSPGNTNWKTYLPCNDRWTALNTHDDRHNDNRLFGFDEEEEQQQNQRGDDGNGDHHFGAATAGYQDMYSVHPDGILTLHRCWLTQSLVKKRESGRIVEKLELNVKEGDVAEWRVTRKPDWDQIKMNCDAYQKKKKQHHQQRRASAGGNGGGGWLSYAEIATYDDAVFDKPLWSHHYPHISFHTYATTTTTAAMYTDDGDDLLSENGGHQFVPPTNPLVLTQDAPEPYASRVDRVGRTAAAAKDGAVLDDALFELEENLSNAMASSLSPSPSGFFGTSAGSAALRLLSPSAGLATSGTAHSGGGLADPLSFESACLVNVCNTQSSYPNSRTSNSNTMENAHHPHSDTATSTTTTEQHHQLTFNHEKEQVYSPDGDNEIASPHDSVLVEDTDLCV
ncbi:hypothetical protein BDB00DRAFT_192295 [Zychaea mexicana]|uniref:uncharacterized protein n=1 Tax=Zychaea mexicana TaxID=64656 RepID=UPI0022FF2626|nr:uncharacterized protein BDB00DRAFT_192295 [Zychaea mexicana]KAI9495760.1 hypothetical protein BDB00DRAFT_192295 [Zychaea mexicana]